MTGRAYLDRTDWRNYLLSIPAPRVVVLEDMDRRPGLGPAPEKSTRTFSGRSAASA